MHVKKLYESVPLEKFTQFYFCFIHYSVWHDKKFMWYKLCDQYSTRIICINKICTENCHFTVSPENHKREIERDCMSVCACACM